MTSQAWHRSAITTSRATTTRPDTTNIWTVFCVGKQFACSAPSGQSAQQTNLELEELNESEICQKWFMNGPLWAAYMCVCCVVVPSIDFNLANIFVCFHLFGQQLDTFSGKNCLPLAKRVATVFAYVFTSFSSPVENWLKWIDSSIFANKQISTRNIEKMLIKIMKISFFHLLWQ